MEEIHSTDPSILIGIKNCLKLLTTGKLSPLCTPLLMFVDAMAKIDGLVNDYKPQAPHKSVALFSGQ